MINVFSEPLRELEAYQILKDRLEKGQGHSGPAGPAAAGSIGNTAGIENAAGTDHATGTENASGTDHAAGTGNAVHILADGCVDPQKAHLLYALCREEALTDGARLRLVITHSDLRAREIAQDCSFYDRNVAVFPARDLIFYQADLRGGEIDKERLRCLRRILEGRPVTVVTTFAALVTPQIPLRVLEDSILGIGRRDTLDLAKETGRLVAMGYEKNYQVERPGQFAVRGDILDIFDLTQENPIRIELWGDEVETIRSFDVLSQRSIEQLEYVRIFPATEMILEERRLHDGLKRMEKEAARVHAKFWENGNPEAGHRLETEIGRICEEARELHVYSGLESFIHYFYPMTESLLDLFPPEKTLVFLDEPVRILQHACAVETEFRESMISRSEKGYVLPGQMDLIREAPQVLARLDGCRTVGLAVLAGLPEGRPAEVTLPDQETYRIRFDTTVQMHARDASLSGMSYEALRAELAQRRKKKERVIIVSPSRTRAGRLAEDLTADDVTAYFREKPVRPLKQGDIMTCPGRMRKGFSYPEIGFTVLTEAEIFGEEKKKKKRVRRYDGGEQIRNFAELRVGDYVVHETYGIGIYRGVEKIEVDHIARDYLKIEYGAGGVLFVMPTDLSVLQKYAAAEGERRPKLNKLGTQEWANTRSKVQKSVEMVADDLVELYAKRQSRQGHVYGPDTVWQRELEEMFPYQETEDQLSTHSSYPRENLKRTQTPQGFPLGVICAAHREALEKGITNSVASCTLMVELGRTIWFCAGSEKNIKLTTPDDMEIFKALLQLRG